MSIDTGTAARLVGVATVAMEDTPTPPSPPESSTPPPASPTPSTSPTPVLPPTTPTRIVDALVKKDREAFGDLQQRVQSIMENNSHYELIHTLIKSSSIPDELSYMMEIILQKMKITGKRLSLLNDGDSLTISGSSYSIMKDSDTYKITKITGNTKDSVSPSARILGVFECILSQSGSGLSSKSGGRRPTRRHRRR